MDLIARAAATAAASAPATRTATRPVARVDAKSPDAVWAIRFANALQGKGGPQHVTILFQRKGGKWVKAIADAPGYNRNVHEVTFDKNNARNGTPPECVAKIEPDPWVPEDGESFNLIISPIATAQGTTVQGKAMTLTSLDTKGFHHPLKGEIMADVDMANAEVNICLESVLTWGEAHERRVEVAFERRDGKHKDIFARSNMPLPKPGGAKQIPPPVVTAVSREVTFKGNEVGGEMKLATVNAAGEAVAATVKLKGVRVGPVMGGTYEGKVGDQEVEGRWRGYVYELEEKAGAATAPAAKADVPVGVMVLDGEKAKRPAGKERGLAIPLRGEHIPADPRDLIRSQ